MDLEDALLPPTVLPKVMAKGLTPSQQEDLKKLLNEFPDVAGERLGRTGMETFPSVLTDYRPRGHDVIRIANAIQESIVTQSVLYSIAA